MKDDEIAALNEQLREIKEFLTGSATSDDFHIKTERRVELLANAYTEPPAKKKRGRPSLPGGSDRTWFSFNAFVIVQQELQRYRKRIGRRRVPDEVADAFIDIALKIYPEADRDIVREHIRKNNTLPIEAELKGPNWREFDAARPMTNLRQPFNDDLIEEP
ncbi:hypothetical protein I6F35_32025 [Bradyrhizobium sp. BRP22]|uniref:hypothetical protein n=1 Tax=Bradyrhizobium sp. BRP22 TaxID=2793821 RepID=UPI001CD1D18E|nr:hypothetical protein [Bradyrhizobium sp. BRP22]MCA1457760.1 hypothetical protein [Bradyrhizobium sp. BRP22]